MATGLTRGIDDVADIIHFATALAKFPRNSKARTAQPTLTRAALDQPIDGLGQQDIDRATLPTVALLLREMAESEGARATGRRSSVREFPLFVIPIIVEFDDSVPESHLEDALHQVTWDRTGKPRFGFHHLDAAGVSVWPTFLRFDDIQHIALSHVLKDVTLASLGIAPLGANQSFTARHGRLKRSTAFLRYLVGQCYRSCTERGPTAWSCAGLSDIIKVSIERSTGRACKVAAFYTGYFFQPLYTGMWRYQSVRLDNITRSVRVGNCGPNNVEATITTNEWQDNFQICVSFVGDGKPLGGRTYLLETRPGENRRRCVRRVSERIAAAGIVTSINEGSHFRSSRNPSLITMRV